MKRNWWKYLGIAFLLYAIIYGFMVRIPETPIGESLRNVFYHVGMWFAMMAVLTSSFINSIKFLKTGNLEYDMKAEQAVRVSFLFGFLGLITGMIWAQFTWGEPWANDPHLNGAVVTIIVYAGYMILRSAITDDEKRGRVAAVLNIFAFVMMLMLLGLLPRLAENTLTRVAEAMKAEILLLVIWMPPCAMFFTLLWQVGLFLDFGLPISESELNELKII